MPLVALYGAAAAAGMQIKVDAFAVNVGVGADNVELVGSKFTAMMPVDVPVSSDDDSEVVLRACLSPNACDSSLPCCKFCVPLAEVRAKKIIVFLSIFL